ncbi:hypothetical protein EVAR_58810_1 [Eumeta japonica]|uniref:Uncharacterized protein n=1 Tax=Eumeta variegata TaxID=151549 RepID=A0A4C1YMV6_EUMVA|nr:hypothetical protein EVAR_58810_1 [Eumeta japonica]
MDICNFSGITIAVAGLSSRNRIFDEGGVDCWKGKWSNIKLSAKQKKREKIIPCEDLCPLPALLRNRLHDIVKVRERPQIGLLADVTHNGKRTAVCSIRGVCVTFVRFPQTRTFRSLAPRRSGDRLLKWRELTSPARCPRGALAAGSVRRLSSRGWTCKSNVIFLAISHYELPFRPLGPLSNKKGSTENKIKITHPLYCNKGRSDSPRAQCEQGMFSTDNDFAVRAISACRF